MSESDSAQYYLESGRNFYGKGEFRKACDSCKKAIEKAGSDNIIASNAHYVLGQAYYERKEYASAKDSLISAIKINHKYADAYNNLGKVHYRLNDYARAKSSYNIATKINPRSADAYNNLGEVHYKLASLGEVHNKLQKYIEAKGFYEKAIEINSNDADFHKNLGEVYYKLQDYAKAKNSYKMATIINPRDAYAYNKLGEVCYKGEKNYPDAIEAFYKAIDAIDIMHDHADAYNNLGEVYYKRKEYDKAENCFDNAIKEKPDVSDAYHNKSKILYYHKKDYFKASETLKVIIERDKSDLIAYCNIAYILWKQARYKEARKAFETAHKVGEKLFAVKSFSKDEFKKQYTIEKLCRVINEAIIKVHEISLNATINTIDWLNELLQRFNLYTFFPNKGFCKNIAELIDKTKEYQDKNFIDLKKDDQNNIIILNRLLLEKYYPQDTPKSRKYFPSNYFKIYGEILHTIFRKLSEAEEIYKKGRDLHPENTDILIGLFKLYIDKRENDDDKQAFAHFNALDVCRKAKELLENLRRDGEYKTFWQLGLLLMEREEYEKAKDCLQAAIKICNDRPDPHVSLGILYIHTDDLPRAIQYFKDALKLDPDDLTIQSNLAGAYLKRGLVKNAEIEYKKILRITQNHIESQIGLGYVYLSLGDNDIDMYNQAIQHFAEGLELTKSDNVSKKLTNKEIADIYYARGCAYVELSKSDKNKVLLHNALEDFKKCSENDENNHDAIRAVKKIKIRFGQMSIEKSGTRVILALSLLVFVLAQGSNITYTKDYFPIPITFYPILTFGSLIFMIAGFILPYLTKLKFSVIELEKAPIDNIITSSPLEITMPVFK